MPELLDELKEGLAKTDELIRRGERQIDQLAAHVQALRLDRDALARMATLLRPEGEAHHA